MSDIAVNDCLKVCIVSSISVRLVCQSAHLPSEECRNVRHMRLHCARMQLCDRNITPSRF